MVPKQTGDSYPIGSLSFWNPVTQKNQNKHDRERERTHSMYSMIHLKTLVSCGRDRARSLPLGRGFLLIPLIMVCFAFSTQMRGALPPEIPGNPDGCYPAFNTAEGCNALFNVTGGVGDTGVGWYSLFIVGNGSFDTGVGAGALALTSGAGSDSNTAVGAAAMLLNTTGDRNTAVGTDAMVFNDDGEFNDAVGAFALNNNTSGSATTLLAIPRFLTILSQHRTLPLVISHSSIMTRPEPVLGTSTRQLALSRSNIILMAIQTTPSAMPRSTPTRSVYSTRPWVFWRWEITWMAVQT